LVWGSASFFTAILIMIVSCITAPFTAADFTVAFMAVAVVAAATIGSTGWLILLKIHIAESFFG
jgi:hypothetical protein